MNASQLFQDIETGALVEIETAKGHYFDNARGLTVRQSFYVYPDDSIVCLNTVDGGYSVLSLNDGDAATLRHRNPLYFQ